MSGQQASVDLPDDTEADDLSSVLFDLRDFLVNLDHHSLRVQTGGEEVSRGWGENELR